MYSFYNTDERIQQRKGVIKQLSALESTSAKVEISGFTKNGKNIFNCKISDGKIVRNAEGNTPESACDNACDAFIKDLRKGKERSIDKAIARRRNSKQEMRAIKEDDVIIEDEDISTID